MPSISMRAYKCVQQLTLLRFRFIDGQRTTDSHDAMTSRMTTAPQPHSNINSQRMTATNDHMNKRPHEPSMLAAAQAGELSDMGCQADVVQPFSRRAPQWEDYDERICSELEVASTAETEYPVYMEWTANKWQRNLIAHSFARAAEEQQFQHVMLGISSTRATE